MTDSTPPTRFVVVIPAKNEAELLPETLRAIASCPAIDSVIVVDDGSTDATSELARGEGATVLKHPRSLGKAEALMTGADVVVRSDRKDTSMPSRGLVFLDADAGGSAGDIGTLVQPVAEGRLDLAIALYRARGSTGGHGFVVGLARDAIEVRTGWRPELPLSGIRALTAAAYACVRPLASGWGVETAMTIDALGAGLRVGEVQTAMTHRPTGKDWRAQLHRARQYMDVRRALAQRPVPGGRSG